ncbi:MAG: hypothetical protein ACKVVP_01705 [Chloroflexota bacterium]
MLNQKPIGQQIGWLLRAIRSIMVVLCALNLFLGLLAPGITSAEADGEQERVDRCQGLPWVPSFTLRDPLVFTYFYYWYSTQSLTDPDLAQFPPRDQPFHWGDPAWHARQFEDMHAAGVDVALPVYWGTGLEWSTDGQDAMVQARAEMLQSGRSAPSLALFLDTNFLAEVLADRPELADLSSAEGLDFMADEAAGFYARVPACHWLTVDGRPVIFLWRPDTEDGARFTYANDVLAVLETRLEERIGARPIIVRERNWDIRARELEVTLNDGPVFGWGAALGGPLIEQQTVAVGPGYDDRHLAGRIGFSRDRESGATFQRDLRVASLSGAPWLLLETWNELWESTAIADTAELGREYIDLAQKETSLFRALTLDQPRDGWVDLGSGAANYLQLLADAPEERGALVEHNGKLGSRPLVEVDDGAGYFHFALPPRLRPHGLRTAQIDVEYLDSGTGSFRLQYESRPGFDTDEVYTESEPVGFTNSGAWRQVRFTLPDVDFHRRQYGGYGDFRIQDLPGDGEPAHVFGRVALSTDRSPRPVLVAPETLFVFSGTMASSLALQWSSVSDAHAYRLEFLPLGRNDGGQSFNTSGWACGSGQEPAALFPRWDGRTQCIMQDVSSLTAGFYQWRAEALDARGEIIGTPSDWSYLVRR